MKIHQERNYGYIFISGQLLTFILIISTSKSNQLHHIFNGIDARYQYIFMYILQIAAYYILYICTHIRYKLNALTSGCQQEYLKNKGIIKNNLLGIKDISPVLFCASISVVLALFMIYSYFFDSKNYVFALSINLTGVSIIGKNEIHDLSNKLLGNDILVISSTNHAIKVLNRKFNNANFTETTFGNILFQNVEMRHVNLKGTSFLGVKLDHVDFRGAQFINTRFIGCDTIGCKFDNVRQFNNVPFESAAVPNDTLLPTKQGPN